MQVKKAALFVARTRPGGWLLRKSWRWLHLKCFMELIQESRHWQAWQHPQPDYALHILLLPRYPYQNLLELSHAGETVLADLLNLTHCLVQHYQLPSRGYRLIVNGGKYQQFKLLHFHLVSDDPADPPGMPEPDQT